jgi:hypothetical protein
LLWEPISAGDNKIQMASYRPGNNCTSQVRGRIQIHSSVTNSACECVETDLSHQLTQPASADRFIKSTNALSICLCVMSNSCFSMYLQCRTALHEDARPPQSGGVREATATLRIQKPIRTPTLVDLRFDAILASKVALSKSSAGQGGEASRASE